jgi:hypothetical protein
VEQPETKYARSGGAYIAYQVHGAGSMDLIWAAGGSQNVELMWESRTRARALRRLGEIARVIRFDKRGTGLSDRAGGLPPFDDQMDDVNAVLNAVGVERAFVWGVHDATPLTIRAPSLTDEDREDIGRIMRLSTSPGDAAAFWRVLGETDVRHVLPSVRVPTLVLGREGFEAGLAGTTGIAVSLGARVAALAEPGEVLVSSTVKDLVAGSGILSPTVAAPS